MEDRLESILNATIQEFIKTGEPVSSDWLYKKYEFGIKPAMIRNELQELADMGFLEQPHHSAGRIPSDKGYEFFVHELINNDADPRESDELFVNLFKKSDWLDLLENLSDKFGLFGMAEDYNNNKIYKGGLDDLMENLDWDSPDEIKEIIKDVEHLEERLNALSKIFDKNDGVEIFIGKKSPVTRSHELSVVAGNYHDNARNVTLVAIGPKRMNYQKVVGVFKDFQKTK